MKSQKWMLIVGIILGVAAFGAFLDSKVGGGILLLLVAAGLLVLYFVLPKPVKKVEPHPFEFKVAGVSYSNDGGRERQDIIREIKAGREVVISLRQYKYNGNQAIAVFADEEQIGNVPADIVTNMLAVWNPNYTVTEYKVLGSGKEAPHGFLVKVTF